MVRLEESSAYCSTSNGYQVLMAAPTEETVPGLLETIEPQWKAWATKDSIPPEGRETPSYP